MFSFGQKQLKPWILPPIFLSIQAIHRINTYFHIIRKIQWSWISNVWWFDDDNPQYLMVKWVKSNVAGRFVHFQQVLAENASAQGVALEAPGMRNLICLVLSCPKMRNLPAKKILKHERCTHKECGEMRRTGQNLWTAYEWTSIATSLRYIYILYIYIYICIRPYSEGMISILCSYIWLQLKMQGPDLYPGRTGDPYPWSIPFWRDRIHLRSCAQLLRSIRTDHCVAIYTLVLSHPTLGWLNEREHNFGWMDDSLENPDVR